MTTDHSIQPDISMPRPPSGPPYTPGYTCYVALISQSGTAAPTATVLFNNLTSQSGDIVWTRNTTGKYRANATDGFPANKTMAFISPYGTNNIGISTGIQANAYRASANIYQVETTYGGSFADDILLNTIIEIRVYD